MARKAGEKGTAKRNVSTKKVIITCQKCGREFVDVMSTKQRKYCESCRSLIKWEVVGEEITPYGKVIVQKKGDKVRKILVE